MVKLRMCELCIAEHALGNSDVFATEEGLVTRSAGGLGTGIKRAVYGFACGGIEVVTADGTSSIGRHGVEKEALRMERKCFR